MEEMRKTVLFLDDEENILNALRRALRKEGYQLFFCLTPEEALRILDTERVDVIFTDYLMPQMTGLEFVKIVRDLHPHAMRCILTGQADLEIAVAAINEGQVHRFLLKPWNDLELKVTLKQLFLQRELESANKALSDTIDQQRARITALEHEHPGISEVQRDDAGVIVLEDLQLGRTG